MNDVDFEKHGYHLIKRLSGGQYSKTYLVHGKDKHTPFIAKVIENQNQSALEKAEIEAKLLYQLSDCPFVVQLHEHFIQDLNLVLIMEYCSQGDVWEYLQRLRKENRTLTEEQVLHWFSQICIAMHAIHQKKILHRDVKTKNIFITESNKLCLGDFGVSKIIEMKIETIHNQPASLVGTPLYLPPEFCLNEKTVGFKSDVWSLGCVLFELMALVSPFFGENLIQIVLRIINHQLLPFPENYSPFLKVVVEKMLCQNPRERPDVEEIMREGVIIDYCIANAEKYGEKEVLGHLREWEREMSRERGGGENGERHISRGRSSMVISERTSKKGEVSSSETWKGNEEVPVEGRKSGAGRISIGSNSSSVLSDHSPGRLTNSFLYPSARHSDRRPVISSPTSPYGSPSPFPVDPSFDKQLMDEIFSDEGNGEKKKKKKKSRREGSDREERRSRRERRPSDASSREYRAREETQERWRTEQEDESRGDERRGQERRNSRRGDGSEIREEERKREKKSHRKNSLSSSVISASGKFHFKAEDASVTHNLFSKHALPPLRLVNQNHHTFSLTERTQRMNSLALTPPKGAGTFDFPLEKRREDFSSDTGEDGERRGEGENPYSISLSASPSSPSSPVHLHPTIQLERNVERHGTSPIIKRIYSQTTFAEHSKKNEEGRFIQSIRSIEGKYLEKKLSSVKALSKLSHILTLELEQKGMNRESELEKLHQVHKDEIKTAVELFRTHIPGVDTTVLEQIIVSVLDKVSSKDSLEKQMLSSGIDERSSHGLSTTDEGRHSKDILSMDEPRSSKDLLSLKELQSLEPRSSRNSQDGVYSGVETLGWRNEERRPETSRDRRFDEERVEERRGEDGKGELRRSRRERRKRSSAPSEQRERLTPDAEELRNKYMLNGIEKREYIGEGDEKRDKHLFEGGDRKDKYHADGEDKGRFIFPTITERRYLLEKEQSFSARDLTSATHSKVMR